MQRVSVVGSSGSGKSTFARQLAGRLDLTFVEMDGLFWGPEWTQATADELRERIVDATAAERWVIDGNYQSKVGALAWERADTIVWLNPPRWRAMWRVVKRTVRRAATGEELWNGNTESWKGLCFWRGEDSILWWAWTSYATTAERYEEAMREARESGDQRWHRLRTPREVERFLAEAR